MAFVTKKKLELASLGDGWATCYIELSGMSFKESREFSNTEIDRDHPESDANLDAAIKLVKDHFLSGKAFDGNGVVEITSDNIEDLPSDVIANCVGVLVGGPTQDLSTTSKI